MSEGAIKQNLLRNKRKLKKILERKEKKKYKKKKNFKINIIFNEKGEALEKIIERAFGNYCLKKN